MIIRGRGEDNGCHPSQTNNQLYAISANLRITDPNYLEKCIMRIIPNFSGTSSHENVNITIKISEDNNLVPLLILEVSQVPLDMPNCSSNRNSS